MTVRGTYGKHDVEGRAGDGGPFLNVSSACGRIRELSALYPRRSAGSYGLDGPARLPHAVELFRIVNVFEWIRVEH
jgi:hypothetical protein